jgi:fido (protein-threonine AMPylation protein)
VRFNGIVQWRPPPAIEALRLMRATLAWINSRVREGVTGTDARDCAARVLFQITDIHPFFDGNGRVARTLATWLLIKGGYALLMDPGSYCHQHRVAYYKALDSHSLDPTLWPKFFAQMVDYCFVVNRHSAALAANADAQTNAEIAHAWSRSVRLSEPEPMPAQAFSERRRPPAEFGSPGRNGLSAAARPSPVRRGRGLRCP